MCGDFEQFLYMSLVSSCRSQPSRNLGLISRVTLGPNFVYGNGQKVMEGVQKPLSEFPEKSEQYGHKVNARKQELIEK